MRVRTRCCRRRARRRCRVQARGLKATASVAVASPLTATERAEFDAALKSARTVRDGMPAGVARDELSGVIANAATLDASGQLTSSRLAATLMTVRRNKQFWPLNPAPAVGTRVVFTGSPVYLEYYRSEGLQIQPLANFGKANAAWGACKADGNATCSKLRDLLDAMLELASQRGTFSTWEYYFDFEGGVPPWTSGMSQATGLQALSRAYNSRATCAIATLRRAPARPSRQRRRSGSPCPRPAARTSSSCTPTRRSCSSSTACCRR